MKYKKSIIVIMLAIFLVSIAAVSASDVNDTAIASEDTGQMELSVGDEITDTLHLKNNEEKLTAGNIWYVNSSAANGEGTIDNPYNNLKDTITASGDNDIIRIASGTYSGENNTNLIIDKNLTLERYGDGEAIFDGSGSYGIWEIQSKSINITGFTFQKGHGGNGGALLFKSELINSNINANFNNNYAGSSGGAIYFAGALTNVNIIGNFTDNIAQSYAGAMYFESKITNVTIFANCNNNSAIDQNGGANWFSALLNVNIIGNYSNNKAYFGGANVFYESLENVNITGNYINNTATFSNGGANQFRKGLKNVAITGDYSYNKAKNGGANYFDDVLNNVNITGNYNHNEAGENGGANRLGNPVLVNIIGNYTNNTAKSTGLWGGGGAIYVQNTPNKITIAANFYNNTAVSQGGAICFYDSMSNVDVTGNFINNNGKSVIYNYGASNSIIHDSIFINNSKINVDGSGTIKIVDTWFGNNATNYNIAPDEQKIDFENWLFLNATVDSNVDDDSKISNITFKLYSYNTSGISDYDNNLLNPINLTITATNGNVAGTARLGETIQFTPTSGGTATVTATVENACQTVEIPVKGDFDLLQDLVNNESLSVINLERNYTYNQFDTITAGVLITRPITINGNGYTIDANGKSRIFKITSDNVVLENIAFVNGNVTGSGGAVYSTSDVNVRNCNFTDNSASRYGGAISIVSSSVENCSFVNNKVTGDNSYAGAVWIDLGSVLNCNFTSSTAKIKGGAVYFYDEGNVTNCNFIDNNVTADESYGGAIYFLRDGTVTNCSFTNNSATKNGGAVYFNEGSTGRTINCNFTNNSARYGGAIRFSSTGNVTNCNFVDNKATSYDGGAIYFSSSGTVENCNFTNNSASEDGGAIWMYSGSVENCNFTNNSASEDGGAVYFWSNGEVRNCNFTNNSASDWGGAILFASTGTVTNCNFIGNNATYYGGAIYFSSSGTTHEVRNCNFTNNSASNRGGAVYFYGNGNVTNCNFTDNNAINGGAVYFFKDSEGTVTNCNFTNNSASEDGGAVYFYDVGNVTNCNFIDNNAINGGAVYFFKDSEGTVTNCNFTNNSASEDGGAVYFYDVGNVTNCNFVNNTASEGGGAINMDFGTVSNCNFVDNKATGDYSYGGAIYIYSGTVTNCNFTGNTATYGGAVYFDSNGEVTNCNFVNNTASEGGGAINMDSGTVSNCNFVDNKATGDYSYGGAIYIYSGTVTNCNFIGNNATYYGGAIYFSSSGTTHEVRNCNFTNNTASRDGGAIDFEGAGTVTNCNFTGNNATTGSAIYFYSTSATKTVFNSRFLNNRANAEALEVTKNDNNITITFTGKDNLLNAIYSRNDAEVTFTDVTYWSANGITTTGSSAIKPSRSNKAAGQNITVGVVVNGELVLSGVYLTDENGMIVLDISAGENYFIGVRHDTDSYYTEAEKTISNNTKFGVNVTSQTTNNKTVNITAKSNIPNEVIDGKLLFIVQNTDPINATYAGNGTWWTLYAFDAYGDYQVNATYSGLDNVTVNNATISISKTPTEITLVNETVDLFVGDSINSGATLTPSVGNLTFTSNNESVAKVEEGNIIAVGEGSAVITVSFAGSDDYAPAKNKTITVGVSKIPTDISVNTVSLDLSVGDEAIIVATLTPADAGNVTFTSSDENVVLIDDDEGNIIAYCNGKGQANITVSFEGNDKYAAVNKTISVTVSLNNANVTVDKDTLDLKVDETYAINATKHPDTILLDITYTSSNSSVATVDKNGIVTAVGEGTAIISVSVGDDEIYAKNSTNVTVSVSRVPTKITASDVSTVYNTDKYLIVNLKDSTGKPISGVKVTADLNGAKEYTTDGNGQIKVPTKGLAPKTYTAKVTFKGNTNFDKSAKNVNVTVKKATPKITAKAKTFKSTAKTKKYTITLKDNTGKAIKKAKVTLKVNGKTYKATTNSKGKATFKITKLNKKGTYKATVAYKGNKYYNKATKKVKITVKADKTKSTFKTVSKGSKDKVTVKKIQRALKNNGYYLTYQGHYLKVDGIYWDCTERSVKEFQHDKGLKVTGKVDEKTAKKLGII